MWGGLEWGNAAAIRPRLGPGQKILETGHSLNAFDQPVPLVFVGTQSGVGHGANIAVLCPVQLDQKPIPLLQIGPVGGVDIGVAGLFQPGQISPVLFQGLGQQPGLAAFDGLHGLAQKYRRRGCCYPWSGGQGHRL